MKRITGIYLFTDVGGLIDGIVFSPGVHIGQGLINGREVAVLASTVGQIKRSPYNPNHIIVHGIEKGTLPISLTPGNYLAVFDQAGRLLAYSDYCCPHCFEITGRHIERTLDIACYKCRHQWQLPRPVNL